MLLMDVDIGIRKDLQNQYTGEEMAVFLILNYLQNNKNKDLFISVDAIGYFLTGRFIDSQADKKIVKGIKKGFESLKKEEDISILGQSRNNFIIDSKSCRVDTQKYTFTIVHLWEIQKIFSSLGAYGFNVLRFFVNIIGTINGNSKSWHMTQDDMVLNWGFSKNTVNEYLRKLEELKLLYTFRPKARKTDKPYHKLGNIYGRYKDKNLIVQEGKQYLSTLPYYKIKKYPINRTSIKLRYNHFLSDSPKYGEPKEIEKLYRDCIKYNDSLKTHPNDEVDTLDLSVFKEYGFGMPTCESKKPNEIKKTSDHDVGRPDPMGGNRSVDTDTSPFNIVQVINIKKKA